MVATVTLSMEVELAWGYHDLEGQCVLSDDRVPETETLDRLLLTCDKYDIPITFDVVGHLLLDSCSGHDSPHPADWFEDDPESNVDGAPLHYAPALVDAIIESSTDHEIATHTFSHTLCDVDPEIVDWELSEVKAVYDMFGLGPPKSIVTPRHSPPPNDVLRKHGIEVVRSVAPRYTRRLPRNRVERLYWMQRDPVVRPPEWADGLVHTYCTPHPSLTAGHLPIGRREEPVVFSLVPTRVRQLLHERYLKRGLQAAIESDSFIHYWTHLYNLSNELQWVPISSFLRFLHRRKEEGKVQILPMKNLPRRVENGP